MSVVTMTLSVPRCHYCGKWVRRTTGGEWEHSDGIGQWGDRGAIACYEDPTERGRAVCVTPRVVLLGWRVA